MPKTPSPEPVKVFFVDPDVTRVDGDGSAGAPWRDLQWPAIDAALAGGSVTVFFSARLAARDENQLSKLELKILRTDTGPNRLILDGRSRANLDDDAPRWVAYSGNARAQWRGATTTEEKVKRSRITLTGFDLKDSFSQGVFWEAGDELVIEDLVIHDNGKPPAIFLQYANRSGLPSDNIAIRNNHLFNITGECVYVGGREQVEGTSHSHVLVENNLIHDCGFRDRNGDDWDGVNLKDRITSAVIRHNVIYQSHWGIQLTSLNVIVEQNIIFDTDASGIMIGGSGWGIGLNADTRVSDNAILRSGGAGPGGTSAGIYVDADAEAGKGAVFTRNTIAETKSGPAMMLAGTAGLAVEISSSWLTDCAQGLDGWGDVQLTVDDTAFFANQKNAKRAPAAVAAVAGVPDVDPKYIDLKNPAGADHVYFTADDGWIAQTQSATRGPRIQK